MQINLTICHASTLTAQFHHCQYGCLVVLGHQCCVFIWLVDSYHGSSENAFASEVLCSIEPEQCIN